MSTETHSQHRLALPGPAVHLRRPRQHADPGPPGRRCAASRSRPSRSAPTRPVPEHGDIYLHRRRRGRPAGAGRPAAASPTAGCTGRSTGARSCSPSAPATSSRHVVLRQGRQVRRPRPARPALRPRPDPRGRRAGRRRRPGAGPADAHRLREPRRPHPPRPGRHAAGQGHAPASATTARTEGAWPGTHARHVHARPGAGPQPGPGRPAAALGDRRAAARRRSTTPGPTRLRERAPRRRHPVEDHRNTGARSRFGSYGSPRSLSGQPHSADHGPRHMIGEFSDRLG